MTFEKALEELEKIAHTLESGDCSLDESVKLYEKAMELSKKCTELLSEAKIKITEITQLEKADEE